jgi:hypothetical protein
MTIHNQKQFMRLCHRADITSEADVEFAAAIWKEAEAAMLGETQVASLLKTQPKIITRNLENSLTHAELQFLTSTLGSVLNHLDEVKQRVKDSVQGYWLLSDENNELSLQYFDALNHARNYQRRIKSRYNRIAGIQSKLKKQMNKGD